MPPRKRCFLGGRKQTGGLNLSEKQRSSIFLDGLCILGEGKDKMANENAGVIYVEIRAKLDNLLAWAAFSAIGQPSRRQPKPA